VTDRQCIQDSNQSVGKSLFVTPCTRGKDNINIGQTRPEWMLCDLDKSNPGYWPLIDVVKAVINN
jgi:hypothetical protein